MNNTHLAIGDCHVQQADDLVRFTLLNKLIKQRRPDKIIFIGDLIEMDSLSSFAKPGSKEKENKRLQQELHQARLAIQITLRSLPKKYNPEIYFCEGNHEYRLQRFYDENPIFENLISLPHWLENTLGSRNATWIPYGRYANVDGVFYTHIPFRNGYPIASVVNTTGAALQLVDSSVVFGHTHRLEAKQALRVGTFKLITALNIGCYFEHVPKYVEKSNPHWWRGVVLLTVYSPGQFDYETISLTQLKALYGDKK